MKKKDEKDIREVYKRVTRWGTQKDGFELLDGAILSEGVFVVIYRYVSPRVDPNNNTRLTEIRVSTVTESSPDGQEQIIDTTYVKNKEV